MAGEVSFTPTAADYAAANRANLLWAFRRPRTYRAWLAIVAILAGVGTLIGRADGGPREAVWVCTGYAVLGLVLMPILYAVSYVLAGRRVGRLVRQQRSATLEQRWTWNDEGFTIEHAQGGARHDWAEMFGWREGRIGIALFINERSFFPLPRRVLPVEKSEDLRATISGAGLKVY